MWGTCLWHAVNHEEDEEIDDGEILRRINALYREISLSQALGRWKRLEDEEANLLKRARPTKKFVSRFGGGVNKKCKVHLCREGRVVDAPVWRRGALDTGGGRQIRQPLKTRKPASRGTEG